MNANVTVGIGNYKGASGIVISLFYTFATIVSTGRALSGVRNVTEMAKITPTTFLFVWGNWNTLSNFLHTYFFIVTRAFNN